MRRGGDARGVGVFLVGPIVVGRTRLRVVFGSLHLVVVVVVCYEGLCRRRGRPSAKVGTVRLDPEARRFNWQPPA